MSGALLPGHRLAVSFETGRYATDPGVYYNRIVRCVVYDEKGKDVTQKYAITLYEGTLQILKRKITITAGSASKFYDGLPLTCSEYWISSGSLAPGDELIVQATGWLVEPGMTTNDIKVEIWGYTPYGSRIKLTRCYDIEIVPGYLEIRGDPSS